MSICLHNCYASILYTESLFYCVRSLAKVRSGLDEEGGGTWVVCLCSSVGANMVASAILYLTRLSVTGVSFNAYLSCC